MSTTRSAGRELGLDQRPLTGMAWIGFILSWFLLAVSVTALYLGFMQVIAVGGFCAEGGPYVIETHCPGNTAITMTLSPFAIALAVALSFFMAHSFGPPAYAYMWSLVFGPLGIGFLIGAFGSGEGIVWSWLFCGILFLAMAIPPLYLLPKHWPISVFGRRRLDGTSILQRGLRVVDALVIGAVWLAVASAGFALAYWFSGL